MVSARPFVAVIGISLFIAAGFPAWQTAAQESTVSTAETLAKLSATIAGNTRRSGRCAGERQLHRSRLLRLHQKEGVPEGP